MVPGASALRIALVSPYDVSHAGGVNEHVWQLAQHQRAAGHTVKIISPASRPLRADANFIPLGRVTPVAVNGSVARISLSLTLAPQIRRILARERFDLVHVHEPLSPTLPTTMLRCSDAVNVGTFHAAGERSLGYTFVRRWLETIAPRLSARIAVSQAAREFANRYFPAAYSIIPNGVDFATYSTPQRPYPGLDDNDPTILFVGRFNEERKGFRYQLEALARIQQLRPNVRLLVAGGGDPRAFKAQIRGLDLRNVHFLGFVSKAELAALYQGVTVFCAPSTGGESFGIVLLEAMAAGCPLVAADNPGYRDVLAHRREGLLVPTHNSEALAVGLLQIIEDSSLRQAMIIAGRQKAQEYAWDRVAAQVLDLYSTIVH